VHNSGERKERTAHVTTQLLHSIHTDFAVSTYDTQQLRTRGGIYIHTARRGKKPVPTAATRVSIAPLHYKRKKKRKKEKEKRKSHDQLHVWLRDVCRVNPSLRANQYRPTDVSEKDSLRPSMTKASTISARTYICRSERKRISRLVPCACRHGTSGGMTSEGAEVGKEGGRNEGRSIHTDRL
jgi:hypothetical protein